MCVIECWHKYKENISIPERFAYLLWRALQPDALFIIKENSSPV
jgi:hypothetical protein